MPKRDREAVDAERGGGAGDGSGGEAGEARGPKRVAVAARLARVVRIRRRGGRVVQDCDVYVGRRMTMGGWNLKESKWANPFTVKQCGGSAAEAVRRFRAYLEETRPDLAAAAAVELRGKTLGCWCAPKPCHADVLAEIANRAVAVPRDAERAGEETEEKEDGNGE